MKNGFCNNSNNSLSEFFWKSLKMSMNNVIQLNIDSIFIIFSLNINL